MQAPDRDLREWSQLFERSRQHYQRYKSLLQADVRSPDFARLEAEVQDTRSVMNSGSVYRGVAKRAKGLGPQDTRPPEDFRPTPYQ